MRQIFQVRALVPAVVIMAVLSAAPALASASEFNTAPSAEVSGVAEDVVFKVGGAKTVCDEATLEGSAPSSGSAQSLEMQPEFSGCTVFGVSGQTVDAAGCTFELDASSDTVDLTSCSSGGIDITAEAIFNTKCEVHIPNQEEVGQIEYSNSEERDVLYAEMDLEMTADVITSTGLCPLGVKNGASLSYAADYALSANDGTDEIWVGVPHEFHVDPAEATLYGALATTHIFRIEGSSWTCGEVEFAGTAKAADFTEQEFTPQYGPCFAFGYQEYNLNFNGCTYVFHAYGTYDLVCPEGQHVDIHMKTIFNTVCHVNIYAQDGINGAYYSDNAEKDELTIALSSNNLNYEVTKSTGLCALKAGGEGSNGQYSGSMTVFANEGAGEVWWD